MAAEATGITARNDTDVYLLHTRRTIVLLQNGKGGKEKVKGLFAFHQHSDVWW